MGSTSGGKKKHVNFRNRQRANMSFFIVVMFFAVFGIIVFTEIFFIDERGRAVGVLVRHGTQENYQHKQDKVVDYEDGVQTSFDCLRSPRPSKGSSSRLIMPQEVGEVERSTAHVRSQFPPAVQDEGENGFIGMAIDGASSNTSALVLSSLCDWLESSICLLSSDAFTHYEIVDTVFVYSNEDYISIRVGAVMNDEAMGALLQGGRSHAAALPVLENAAAPASSKIVTDTLLPPYPENFTITDGAWQTVNGTRFSFFVFSAFYDPRKQRQIRVIGATRTRGPERVWCRLWHKINEFNSSYHISVTVPAKIKVIRENWNLKYSACFVLCPLANRTVPSAVSIVARVKDSPSNLLAVINNYNETTPTNKFAVCVKPLHFDYNREIQIMEFIELNRLMGVEHFTFYNHTIGRQVDCILRDYVDRGLVTMLPWQLQMASQKEIRTEGLFAALNDCLYRSMNKYSHILLIDLDEYIIPKYNDTLPQLIDYVSHRLNTRSTGAFSFQNAFFYLQWDDDDSVYSFDDPVSANLVTLKKTRRKSKLHPHKQRSKYICRPELTVEAGNHFVWEFIPGHGTLNVPPDAAILHHYRICEFGGDDCIKTSSTVDTTAYRYKDILTSAVKVQYERLRGRCGLSELKFPPARVFNKLINLLGQS
ncbi:hypothetical protein NQ317_000390 [Molorchus minor]|uniref:Glycosyltransferase family 92 protein n=1 Tax=Molorchus minor TaxID=1323400 RepID=A0ABQ9JAQ9_9CUCU|nr:hypothetical protein NQ317_000390 [Molorchus minor]